MRNKNLRDNEILLLAAAAATFIGAAFLTAKLVPSGSFFGKNLIIRKYPALLLPKQVLEDYINKGGTKVRLAFREGNGGIKLSFVGLTSQKTSVIKLHKIGSYEKVLGSAAFGLFSEDTAQRSLHDILTASPLRDWYLYPEECTIEPGYVSYELTDVERPVAGGNAVRRQAFSTYRINPCPPGC